MKKIIIMGASSGMGLRVAEMLASRKVRIGVAGRHTGPLEALKRKYSDYVEYASIDVTKPDGPMLLEELAEKTGGMDIYLHMAGIGYENLDLDPEREAAIVSTNAVGFARMIDAAYRYMRSRGVRGHIAAVTSVAGTKGIGRLSAYSASKAFGRTYLVALRQLACEEKSGIFFTDIRPGWVDTPLLLSDVKYPLMMTEDYAARRIIKAMAHRESVCTFDLRWKMLTELWQLLPDSLWVRMKVKISKPDLPLPARLTPEAVAAANRKNAGVIGETAAETGEKKD